MLKMNPNNAYVKDKLSQLEPLCPEEPAQTSP